MATKKRGLGQGIDSLIPNKVNANKETETVKVNGTLLKVFYMQTLPRLDLSFLSVYFLLMKFLQLPDR